MTMTPMKVLRISRHEPTPEQLAELKRLYGDDVVIHHVSTVINNEEHLRELVRMFEPNVIEAVLPLWLLALLLNNVAEGRPVVRPIFHRVSSGGVAESKFTHYMQIVKLDVVTRKLRAG